MEVSVKKNKNVDMTKGSPIKVIVLFTLPLLLGNLFQQLYNIFDSAIVGKFVGDEAMGAVSSSGSLINLLIGLIQGTAVGAGIVIAQYFGAREKERMSRAIHTTVLFLFILGIIMTFVGYYLAPILLEWMDTPSNILTQAVEYFHTFFLGIIFTLMYNAGSAILRAVGDSRHPLYYLMISSVLNILLDLLFVGALGWGIQGAAVATIIAQAVSTVLTFLQLMFTKEDYKFYFSKLKFDLKELKKIIAYGIPMGIQNSIISFSNVFVLANINSFGDLANEGYGVYTKIERFATLPSGSFSMALANYVGQNIGAKKNERAKSGGYKGLLLSVAVTEAIGIILYFFAYDLASFFTDTTEVKEVCASQASVVALFYFLLAYSHGVTGLLRGAGYSKTPMIITMLCWVVIRIVGIPLALEYISDQRTTIYWFYPFTWTLSFIALTIVMIKTKWYKKKNID